MSDIHRRLVHGPWLALRRAFFLLQLFGLIPPFRFPARAFAPPALFVLQIIAKTPLVGFLGLGERIDFARLGTTLQW